jgi:hypothetical protein
MGRKPTGRSTKVIRVPNDFDYEKAARLYYDLLPSLEFWYEQSKINNTSPRYDALRKLLSEACIADMLQPQNPTHSTTEQ